MWIALQQFQPAGPIEGACRSNRPGVPGTTKTKHKTNTIMKKKLIIASIIAAITATAYAGAKCMQCNGTGWKGQFKCATCGGDGEI
jgi:DnaJ-class molecular chaperone